jgi:protein-tyrosine phosphatase
MSVAPASNDAQDTAQTGAPNRHLRIPGTRNLRDVGGYPAGHGRRTRWRTLYRTDALDRLPATSQATLIDLGLRHVVDLRWPHEVAGAPSVFARSSRVRYTNIALWDDPAPEGDPASIYSGAFDTRADVLASIARTLLEADGLPAVIGCAAGVDRTGVSIALLLSAVGVPIEVCATDYGLSVETYAASEDAVEGMDEWRSGPVSLNCLPEYMLQALEHLQRRHGGARALLAREGLSEAQLDRLTDLLTEGVAA